MTIGDKIKLLREQHGISQTDLAFKISVSKQTLYKYENNIITNIPSDKIELIARELSSSPQYLMGWTDDNPDSNLIDDFSLDLIKKFNEADDATQKVIINLLAFSQKMNDENK